MLPQATIKSLPKAFQLVKEMNAANDSEWDGDYRVSARQALKEILEGRMRDSVSFHIKEAKNRGGYDRRNGHYTRHVITELGDIELCVPRSRAYSSVGVIRAYARRAKQVDDMILACFLLGLSTRKVSQALIPVLGEPVSPSVVSRVAKTLDSAVDAFHKRKLENRYRALVFDGVVLSRKTGAGAVRRPVLVVLGIRHDGKKEVIDFRLAESESSAEWEVFLNDIYHRGLTGVGVEIIGVDGGKGLLSALPMVYPSIAVQRCWAHKTRNITEKVKKSDREEVKAGLRKISHARNIVEARKAAGGWVERWKCAYPQAVKCLRGDLDDLLVFYKFKDEGWRKATRTTNAIERRFREVRRRTRPMGVFSDRTSMERILYAVFMNENRNQGSYAPFLLTQKS